MKKAPPASKLLRVSDYTASYAEALREAVQAYWDSVITGVGKEPMKASMNDIVRTALGFMEDELIKRGHLKEPVRPD